MGAPIFWIQFIYFSPQTSQHNDKIYIDGKKGHTELVSSSLKLIAGEIGKKAPILPATRRTGFLRALVLGVSSVKIAHWLHLKYVNNQFHYH